MTTSKYLMTFFLSPPKVFEWVFVLYFCIHNTQYMIPNSYFIHEVELDVKDNNAMDKEK
jgi:hypothetical protein